MSDPQDHPLFDPIVQAISRWRSTPPAEPTYGDLAAEIVKLVEPARLPYRVDAFCQRHPDVAVERGRADHFLDLQHVRSEVRGHLR